MRTNVQLKCFCTAIVASLCALSPAAAQERIELNATKFGPGAHESGVTVNDTVRLTARLTGSGFSSTWLLRIMRIDGPNQITGLVDCRASPCVADIISREPATVTFQAILMKGADWAPIRSPQVNVVWARRDATKLTLELSGVRQVAYLNDRFQVVKREGGDETAPVKSTAGNKIPALARVDFNLPSSYSIWLVHGSTTICGPGRQECRADLVPPWVGFHARMPVSAYICPTQASCVVSGSSVATIGVNWIR